MAHNRCGLLVLGSLLAAVAAGCNGEHAVDAQGAAPAPGEVWLTPSEVENAGIVVAPVEEQDVDNTILTAGKVAFDDTHVTHVFSPSSSSTVISSCSRAGTTSRRKLDAFARAREPRKRLQSSGPYAGAGVSERALPLVLAGLLAGSPAAATEWPMYAGSPRRLFFNPAETYPFEWPRASVS